MLLTHVHLPSHVRCTRFARGSACICISSPRCEASTSNSTSTDTALTPTTHKKLAVLKASKQAAHPVQEIPDCALAEYMTLPASQYSVLDANRIERLGETTFRCYVGGLKFLKFVVEPVLTVSVEVGEHGPTVRLLSTKLEGSRFVQGINDKFDATMTNIVRWREPALAQHKEITSDTTIQVVLEVPGWCSFIPVPAIQNTGSSVLQQVLDVMVPRFLAQLERDYRQWAAGDTSRSPVGTGEL